MTYFCSVSSPPHRFRYGFRGNPVIFITASPKVGEKQVRLTYLTNWIERKLKEEFKVQTIYSKINNAIISGLSIARLRVVPISALFFNRTPFLDELKMNDNVGF